MLRWGGGRWAIVSPPALAVQGFEGPCCCARAACGICRPWKITTVACMMDRTLSGSGSSANIGEQAHAEGQSEAPAVSNPSSSALGDGGGLLLPGDAQSLFRCGAPGAPSHQ